MGNKVTGWKRNIEKDGLNYHLLFSLCVICFSVCADFSCDETDKGPPVQMHSLREFEQVRTCVNHMIHAV